MESGQDPESYQSQRSFPDQCHKLSVLGDVVKTFPTSYVKSHLQNEVDSTKIEE